MKEKLLLRTNELIADCRELIELAKKIESHRYHGGSGEAKFRAFKTSAIYFLNSIDDNSEYYKVFKASVLYFKTYNLEVALELLKKIKKDIETDWFKSLRGLISADIFTDFFQMAEHLLEEKYKDAAAVIIGSILEENLRELCNHNKIEISTVDSKTGKSKYKKAETMNTELCKNDVYNILTQKSVTAWLALRNNAAHGKYTEYDIHQVENLLNSVRDFTN